jgi:hypothetical protein
MAIVNPKLMRTIPVELTVQVPDIHDDARWYEIMDFCDDPDTKGEYEWSLLSRNVACFCFTDPDAAFECKMRFG